MSKAKIAEKTLLVAALLGLTATGATAPVAAQAKQQSGASSTALTGASSAASTGANSAASTGAASAPAQSESSRRSGQPIGATPAKTKSPSRHTKRKRREEASEYNGVSFATIFGPGLFGRHTACGQLLSKQVVGVANRTLPCGTLVKVSYRGKRLVIPVIDRGPYGPLHANWDLTLGAARLLHIRETTRIKARIAGHVKNSPELGAPGEEDLLTGVPSAPQPLSGATGGVSSS